MIAPDVLITLAAIATVLFVLEPEPEPLRSTALFGSHLKEIPLAFPRYDDGYKCYSFSNDLLPCWLDPLGLRCVPNIAVPPDAEDAPGFVESLLDDLKRGRLLPHDREFGTNGAWMVCRPSKPI